MPIHTTGQVALATATLLLAACLSHTHVIERDELVRLAAAPPSVRGQNVRVVQEFGVRRGRAIRRPPDAPVIVEAPDPPFPQVHFDDVSSRSGRIKDEVAAEIMAVVVALSLSAAFAGTSFTITEGFRYDGHVACHPDQPLHLRMGGGRWRTLPFSHLDAATAAQAEEALLKDDEGWGLRKLGRRPLDRQGFALRLELGTTEVGLERYVASGFASHLQAGVFPHRRFGVLATLSQGGGLNESQGAFNRLFFGLEAQTFLQPWHRLHVGGYMALGARVTDTRRLAGVTRPSAGVGVLLELGVLTRLALNARAGFATDFDGHWLRRRPSAIVTAGVSIY